jgi:Ser/Thr protein kinase RdoA (MazF antagonist)
MLAVVHSQPAPTAIADLARPLVGVVTGARLERVFANHVYRLETAGGVVFAKLARRGWRSLDDARWEQQLVRHLAGADIAVAEPIGDVLPVTCPEGARPLSLTRALPGAKPVRSIETYLALGQALARLHEAGTSFAPTVPGRLLGASHLVRRPVSKALPTLRDRGFPVEPLATVAEACADTLDRLVPDLPFGAVHGDATLDNIHIQDEGNVAFFDFDLGGHGWFAYDLIHVHGWAADDPDVAGPFWHAMVEGYGRVRPLTDAELESLPWFHLAYQIWDLEHELRNYADWFGCSHADDAVIRCSMRRIEALARPLEATV